MLLAIFSEMPAHGPVLPDNCAPIPIAHAPGVMFPPRMFCSRYAPLKVIEFSKSRRVATVPSGLRTTIFQWPWIWTPVVNPPEGPCGAAGFGAAVAVALADAGDAAALLADCTAVDLDADCARAAAAPAKISASVASADKARRGSKLAVLNVLAHARSFTARIRGRSAAHSRLWSASRCFTAS